MQKSQSSIALTKRLRGKSRIRNREPRLLNPDRGHYEKEVVRRKHPTRQGVFFFWKSPKEGGEKAASGAKCLSTLNTAQCNPTTKGAFAPQTTKRQRLIGEGSGEGE